MDVLIGIIAILLGGLWLQTKKRESAEALLEVSKTKEQVKELEVKNQINEVKLEQEEAKRKELNENKDDVPTSDSDILDHLNRKK